MTPQPNSFTLNLEQLLSGVPLDTAVGVLQITLIRGTNLKGVKLGGGTPDPYVSFSISQRTELARSKTKRSTCVVELEAELIAQGQPAVERDQVPADQLAQ